MVFKQTTNADPALDLDLEADWVLPYDRTNRSRINGLGSGGVAWLNTSDPQPDGGGYLGEARLALKTIGQTNIQVAWTGGTVTPNSRVYAMRLQFRTSGMTAFSDVLDANGHPCEYVSPLVAGHCQVLAATLPAAADNQPYVQLRWKYYHVTGGSGPRTELRLDDIFVNAQAISPPAFAALQTLTGGGWRLEFTGPAYQTYLLQTSTNLTEWSTLAASTTGAGGRVEYIDASPNGPVRFYRLRTP
jgi:hypothetical protein